MRRKVYLIVPVYNEASVVGPVLKKMLNHYDHIICVDDGSVDESARIISETEAILIRHPINLGAGAATQTGIDYALQDKDAEFFVTIDSDGQHDINDVSKMLDLLQKQKLDVVFGSRFLGKIKNISSLKRLFLKAAAVFSHSTSGVKLSDPHIGIRVFNRKFAENLKISLPDFSHASEVVERIKEGNYKYGECPVTVTYTNYTKAKGQPMLNAINISFDLFMNRFTKR